MFIAKEELALRTEKLRARMKKEGFDALVIYSDEYRTGHASYITSYKPINVIEESPQLVMLVGDSAPVVFLGRLNAYAAKDMCWIEDVRGIHRPYTDFPEIASISDKRTRVGLIGKNILPVEIYEQICEALSKRHLSLEMTSCSIYERLNRLLKLSICVRQLRLTIRC